MEELGPWKTWPAAPDSPCFFGSLRQSWRSILVPSSTRLDLALPETLHLEGPVVFFLTPCKPGLAGVTRFLHPGELVPESSMVLVSELLLHKCSAPQHLLLGHLLLLSVLTQPSCYLCSKIHAIKFATLTIFKHVAHSVNSVHSRWLVSRALSSSKPSRTRAIFPVPRSHCSVFSF